MRCARLAGVGRVEPAEMPLERPHPGESLVRVTHVGICGSDLHIYRHGGIGDAKATFPFVMGHEGVGVVEKGLLAGERIGIEPTIHCGRCEQCRRGAPNLCLDQRFLSLPPDQGMLRERLWHRSDLLAPVPSEMPSHVATLLEPLAIALHAFDLLSVRGGSRLAILGCGGMGLCCLLLARQFGAPFVACTDVLDYRCEAARSLGADAALNPSREEVASLGTFDYVIEASGDEGAHRDMLDLATPGAKIAVIGTPWKAEIRLAGHAPRRKGLTLYMVRRSRNSLERSVALAATGRLPLERLVTHVFPLDRAQEAFDTASEYRDGCLKTVIEI